jgi:hypothetical protein
MSRLLLLGAALLLTGCAGAPHPGTSTRHVVMVSGRDDHGLQASPTVLLTSRPGGGPVVGPLPDGTLVEVRDVQGTQTRISAPGINGWVDDFALRGELRLAGPAPTCQVQLGDQQVPAGTRVEVLELAGSMVQVRRLDGPRIVGLVPRAWVTELAPAPGQFCPYRGSGRSTG